MLIRSKPNMSKAPVVRKQQMVRIFTRHAAMRKPPPPPPPPQQSQKQQPHQQQQQQQPQNQHKVNNHYHLLSEKAQIQNVIESSKAQQPQPQPQKQQQKQNVKQALLEQRVTMQYITNVLSFASVAGDGHCLFSSLAYLLSPLNLGFDAKQLRNIVANRILNENDTEATDVLISWIVMMRDAAKNNNDAKNNNNDTTYQLHFRHLLDVPNIFTSETISLEQRRCIYDNMNTSKYWGDEFAISTIENAFNISIIILNENQVKLKQLPTVLKTPSVSLVKYDIVDIVKFLDSNGLNKNAESSVNLSKRIGLVFLYHTQNGRHFEPILVNNKFSLFKLET